jgi:hypothetical protein
LGSISPTPLLHNSGSEFTFCKARRRNEVLKRKTCPFALILREAWQVLSILFNVTNLFIVVLFKTVFALKLVSGEVSGLTAYLPALSALATHFAAKLRHF